MTTFRCVLLALCALILVANMGLRAADEEVTFKKRRLIHVGDSERVEINVSSEDRTQKGQAGKRSTKMDYVTEYLGDTQNPVSKQLVTIGEVVQVTSGKTESLALNGKKLVAQHRDGKTGFRFVDGDDVGQPETRFLQKEFGGSPEGGGATTGEGVSWFDLLSPKKAATVGQSWALDMDQLAKQTLSAFEGLTLDQAGSRGQAKLLKIYKQDGVTYAQLKVEAEIAALRSTSKDVVIKFSPPLVAKMNGTYDFCIDGASSNYTVDVKLFIKGTGVAKTNDGELPLPIDATLSGFKKYTLLSKK